MTRQAREILARLQGELDCRVNAGAGLELGLLRREGSALVLSIGLPLAAGLTLPQFAAVLAHEFGHFGHSAGLRLGRLIRGVNAWFHRVVYERDDWDESLSDGASEGGWMGFACLIAQGMVWLGRKLLFVLMVLGHGVSCFLSRQMEFDADQYGARIGGSGVFADTALRVRMLDAAASFVLSDGIGPGRWVDDLPALMAQVARQAPPRLVAEMRMEMQRSGTGLFDTHPSDLERVRRVRAGRFPGLVSGNEPAAVLFNDFPAVCRTATLHFYDAALGHAAPPVDALLPVTAFLDPESPPGSREPAGLTFPPERAPRLAAYLAPLSGDATAVAAARSRFHAASRAGNAALERFLRGEALLADAAKAEALLSAGLALQARDFSLPAATPDGIERTRGKAMALQADAAADLQAVERALGERLALALGALAGPGVPQADALRAEAELVLAALPSLENAQFEARSLRRECDVLECLLVNLEALQAHAGIDGEIQRRLPPVHQAVSAVRSALEHSALPSPAWDIPPPRAEDGASHLASARRALAVLDAQHPSAVNRLTQIAEQVESAMGAGHRS